MKLIKKIIGYCGVDSGQLLCIDPCYLSGWKDGEYTSDKGKPKNHYEESARITQNKNNGGEIIVSPPCGNGVVFGSGHGDGNYPVVAYYEKGCIKKIEIKFF